ncbi:MAG: hypothetical protein JOZ42_07980, partial [Acetobacteraceae bacterium]|nr:hypothetical protein [Acetobacteraceae bacterium]
SVFGVPDGLRGETLLAVVQPKGPEPPAVEQLAAHCRRLLPRHKLPRGWRFCENWLRTSSGKTDHARLAALYRS